MQSKVQYWLNLCDEDLKTAELLINGHRLMHGGYFCHQVVEKALKAIIASQTSEIPPKVHDLRKLAKIGEVFDELSKEQISLLVKLLPLQIEARYPAYKKNIEQTLNSGYCKELLKETEEFLCWTRRRLEN